MVSDRTASYRPCLLVTASLLLSTSSMAQPQDLATRSTPGDLRDGAGYTEPYDSGWAIAVDNDAFALTGDDENFTLGAHLTFSGRRTRDVWFSLDPVLGLINRGLRVQALFPSGAQGRREHAFQVGAAGFTPRDLADPDPIPTDHPYACLLFADNTRVDAFPEQRVAYSSNFLFGLLGTDACKVVQRQAHKWFDFEDPQGWQNQISDGGEPTVRWSLGRQRLVLDSGGEDRRRGQVIGSLEAAVGMTTQVGVGASWRWGRIRSPWWNFNPQFSEYFALATPTRRNAAGQRELYLWGGFMVRYRFYNALIQGQFRDSAVEIDGGDRNRLLAEGWLGVTVGIGARYDLSWVVRVRTREVDQSENTVPVWGGLILRRTF